VASSAPSGWLDLLLFLQPAVQDAQDLVAGGRRRQRSDPAAAWQCRRQSRALAGGLSAEPSWLPSATCAAAAHHTVRRPRGVVVPGCPDAHRAVVALSASSVTVGVSSVRPSSVRRPVCAGVRYVSGVRASSVRCPARGVRRPASGVRCEPPASGSTLSAPMGSWIAWVQQAATRLGQAGPGLVDPWKLVSRLVSKTKPFMIRNEDHRPSVEPCSQTSYEPPVTPSPAVMPASRFSSSLPTLKCFTILHCPMSPFQASLATPTLVLSSTQFQSFYTSASAMHGCPLGRAGGSG
jgi:hypothetical protein